MGRKVIPPYPNGELGEVTVSVRLSPSEVSVLDYMRENTPGSPSRGGLLRSIYRGVSRPAGRVVHAYNVKMLRNILQKKSVLAKGEDEEIQAARLVVLLSAGEYRISRPIDPVTGLDYVLLGAGYNGGFLSKIIFESTDPNGGLDLSRLYCVGLLFMGVDVNKW